MEEYVECDSQQSLTDSDTIWQSQIESFVKTHYPKAECLRFGLNRATPTFKLIFPQTYGNLRYTDSSRTNTTTKIFSHSSILAQYISQYWSNHHSPLPFSDFINKLDSIQLPYFKAGHLLNWLTASDLVEFGILLPATSLDLANYFMVAGAAGATGGVSTALGLHDTVISD